VGGAPGGEGGVGGGGVLGGVGGGVGGWGLVFVFFFVGGVLGVGGGGTLVELYLKKKKRMNEKNMRGRARV